MKKSLLIGAAMLTGLTLSAQSGKKIAPVKDHAVKFSKSPRVIDTDNGVFMGLQPRVTNANAKVTAPPYKLVSATVNMFGWIVQTSNVLNYNADLNTVVITQRYNPDWGLAAAAGRSGYTCAFWSSDNGGTWDSTLFSKNDVNLQRYPSAAILNTAGNTDPKLARICASGPYTVSAGGWPGSYFSSALMDGTLGTNHVQTANDQAWYSSTAAGLAYNTAFPRYSSVENNGTVWIGAEKYKTAGTPAGLYGAALFKGTFNTGTGKMDYVQDSSLIYKWTQSAGESDLSSPQIAFGADKMTGYILINGNDSAIAASTGIMTGYKPMVWKTTDAGATWTRVNQNFDWTSLNIWGNLLPVAGNSGCVLPTFLDTYGGEITVDSNGKLHYATAASPGWSNHHDSLTYIHSYNFGYTQCDDKPWIFDFVTDGSGSWNANFIDVLNTSKLGSDPATDTTANYNPWVDATTPKLAGDNAIQISRSADGSKIFYTWTDSDPTASLYNNAPSLKSMGYDVATNMYTATKSDDYTNTLSGFWYKFSSEIAMTPSAGNYSLPLVYVDSRDGSYNDGSTIDVYYADDITFADAEFTVPTRDITTICTFTAPTCYVGATAIKQNKANDNLSVYPNPSNGVFNVKTFANNSQLEVFNMIGERVYSKSQLSVGINTINLSNLPKGTYVVRILSGNDVSTKKIIISE